MTASLSRLRPSPSARTAWRHGWLLAAVASLSACGGGLMDGTAPSFDGVAADTGPALPSFQGMPRPSQPWPVLRSVRLADREAADAVAVSGVRTKAATTGRSILTPVQPRLRSDAEQLVRDQPTPSGFEPATLSSATLTVTNSTAAPFVETVARPTLAAAVNAAVTPLAALAVATGLSDVPQPGQAVPGAQVRGAWSTLRDWPLIAIHASLLPDGRVMTYGTQGNGTQTGMFIYDIWDPAQGALDRGHLTLPNQTQTDLFCSAQTLLPDSGRLWLTGGDNYLNGKTNNRGNNNTNLLDPASNQLTRSASMLRPRWYATPTLLTDGSVHLQGGLDSEDRAELRRPDGSHVLLTGADTTGLNWWYPRNFLAPDGRVFGFDTDGRVYFFDPRDNGRLERLDNLEAGFMGNGSSAVQYAPFRVLQLGGYTPRTAVVDFSGPIPVAQESQPMTAARYWSSSLVLPTGQVMVVGGSQADNVLEGAQLTADLWNPATGQWTTGAAGALPRLYHSTALLLNDGTVLVAGGGAPGPLVNTNAQIYFPPYLFTASGTLAPRPVVTSAPTVVAAGSTFPITMAAGSTVASAALVRAGTTTHDFHFDGRRIPLTPVVAGQTVNFTLPADAAVIPPGFYQLFVMDAAGVPALARMIRVTATAANAPRVDWTGRTGNAGTGDFQAGCATGELMVGLHGHAVGGLLQQLGPRCVGVAASGAWTGAPRDAATAGGAVPAGTPATARFSQTCPVGQAVSGFSARVEGAVRQVTLQCRPLAASDRFAGTAVQNLAAVGTAMGDVQAARSCSSGRPARLIYGRQSDHVNAFGLQCGAPGTTPGGGSGACNRLQDGGFEKGAQGWAAQANASLIQPGFGSANAAQLSGGWANTLATGIQPGVSYTASLHTRNQGTQGTAGFGLEALNAQGATIAQATVGMSNSTAWQRTELVGVAPAGTTQVRVWVWADGNRTVQLDQVDFRQTGCQ